MSEADLKAAAEELGARTVLTYRDQLTLSIAKQLFGAGAMSGGAIDCVASANGLVLLVDLVLVRQAAGLDLAATETAEKNAASRAEAQGTAFSKLLSAIADNVGPCSCPRCTAARVARAANVH